MKFSYAYLTLIYLICVIALWFRIEAIYKITNEQKTLIIDNGINSHKDTQKEFDKVNHALDNLNHDLLNLEKKVDQQK